jgi:hypothetical protein
MKFVVTPAFDLDFAALPAAHRRMFLDRIAIFSAGCDAWVATGPSPHPWPANLRIHQLANSRVWLMTWHYRRPDGRATFEFITADGHTIVKWRRIGGHDIYADT